MYSQQLNQQFYHPPQSPMYGQYAPGPGIPAIYKGQNSPQQKDFTVLTKQKHEKHVILMQCRDLDSGAHGVINMDQFEFILNNNQVFFSSADRSFVFTYFVSKQNKIMYEQAIQDMEKSFNSMGEVEWFLKSNPINAKKASAKGNKIDYSQNSASTKESNNPINPDSASQTISGGFMKIGGGQLTKKPGSYISSSMGDEKIDLMDPIQSQKAKVLLSKNRENERNLKELHDNELDKQQKLQILQLLKELDIEPKHIECIKGVLQNIDLNSEGLLSRSDLEQRVQRNTKVPVPPRFLSHFMNFMQPSSQNPDLYSYMQVKKFVELLMHCLVEVNLNHSNRMKGALTDGIAEIREQTEQRHPVLKIIQQRIEEKFKTLQLCFRTFDTDKDGAIGFKEFLEGINSIGINLTDKDLKQAFDILDQDDDGRINFDEFCALHEGKHHQRAFAAINSSRMQQHPQSQRVSPLRNEFPYNNSTIISHEQADEQIKPRVAKRILSRQGSRRTSRASNDYQSQLGQNKPLGPAAGMVHAPNLHNRFERNNQIRSPSSGGGYGLDNSFNQHQSITLERERKMNDKIAAMRERSIDIGHNNQRELSIPRDNNNSVNISMEIGSATISQAQREYIDNLVKHSPQTLSPQGLGPGQFGRGVQSPQLNKIIKGPGTGTSGANGNGGLSGLGNYNLNSMLNPPNTQFKLQHRNNNIF